MNAIRPLVVTATVIAAALTLTAAPSQAASNLLACKRMVWGNGLAAGKGTAKRLAIGNWVANVSTRYGRRFATLAKAVNPVLKCARAGENWRCVLGARPCKASFRGHKGYEKPPRNPYRGRHRRTR